MLNDVLAFLDMPGSLTMPMWAWFLVWGAGVFWLARKLLRSNPKGATDGE